MPKSHVGWLHIIKTHRYTIILFILLCISVFLRLYHLPETIRFFDDQGMDMLIIWNMEHMHHLPLVGPWLSLPNVYVPPTYYYITWFFYHITGSVTGVVYGYFIMNIVGIVALIALARSMGGQKQSIIIASLLAISAVMIEHGRQFWQPYPMQLFLSLWLLCIWHAHTSKRVFLLWLGTMCFQIAFSIYPSPILLVPCVGYQLFYWYRLHGASSSVLRSTILSCTTFISTFFIAFFPQIWFEATHHFPTWNTLITSVGNTALPNLIVFLGRNIYGIFASFFAVNTVPIIGMWLLSVFIGVFIVFFVTSKEIKTTFSPILTPLSIFSGLILLLVYPFDIHVHRMWTFLPILYLISSHMMSRMMHKRSLLTYISLIVFCIYIITNAMVVSRTYLMDTSPKNTIEASRMIAGAIERDMSERHITETSVGLAHKIPNDPTNGSYGIYRIAFWLLETNTFVFPVTPEGNMTKLDYSRPPVKPFMYVVCEGFLSSASELKQCVEPIMESHSFQILKTIVFGKSRMYIVFIDDLSPPLSVSNE